MYSKKKKLLWQSLYRTNKKTQPSIINPITCAHNRGFTIFPGNADWVSEHSVCDGEVLHNHEVLRERARLVGKYVLYLTQIRTHTFINTIQIFY